METSSSTEITRLLVEMTSQDIPDPSLQTRLFELVYDELRRRAKLLMGRERRGHTLQPTALVHESYLRLVQSDRVQWVSRAHFLGVAARCMRQILVDHARARAAEKRGGSLQRVTLNESIAADGGREIELFHLDDALHRLAALDARAGSVAEMRLFGGMTIEETARVLNVSTRTVDGDWATARLWLSRELR